MSEQTLYKQCKYDDMTVEELQQRLQEIFFSADELDDQVITEINRIIISMDNLKPIKDPYIAEESWERFLQDRAEELVQLGFLICSYRNNGRFDT